MLQFRQVLAHLNLGPKEERATGSNSPGASGSPLARLLAVHQPDGFNEELARFLLSVDEAIPGSQSELIARHSRVEHMALEASSNLGRGTFVFDRDWFDNRSSEVLFDEASLVRARDNLTGIVSSLVPDLNEGKLVVGPNKTLMSIQEDWKMRDPDGKAIPLDEAIKYYSDLVRCRITCPNLSALEKVAESLVLSLGQNDPEDLCVPGLRDQFPRIVRMQNFFTRPPRKVGNGLYRAINFAIALDSDVCFELQIATNTSAVRGKLDRHFVVQGNPYPDAEAGTWLTNLCYKTNIFDYEEYLKTAKEKG